MPGRLLRPDGSLPLPVLPVKQSVRREVKVHVLHLLTVSLGWSPDIYYTQPTSFSSAFSSLYPVWLQVLKMALKQTRPPVYDWHEIALSIELIQVSGQDPTACSASFASMKGLGPRNGSER